MLEDFLPVSFTGQAKDERTRKHTKNMAIFGYNKYEKILKKDFHFIFPLI